MGQRRITIELTEYQARVVRWAVNRAAMVTPAKLRGIIFMRKLDEALEIINEATEGLEEIPLSSPQRRVPATPTKYRTTPSYAFTGRASVGWRGTR